MNCFAVFKQHDSQVSSFHFGDLGPSTYAAITLNLLANRIGYGPFKPLILNDSAVCALSNGKKVLGELHGCNVPNLARP